MSSPTQAIAEAVERIGGPAATAAHLGLSPAAVYQWISGTRPVPAERCPDIERLCGAVVAVESIRPDVRWLRVRDVAWPRRLGRPCIDAATPATTEGG